MIRLENMKAGKFQFSGARYVDANGEFVEMTNRFAIRNVYDPKNSGKMRNVLDLDGQKASCRTEEFMLSVGEDATGETIYEMDIVTGSYKDKEVSGVVAYSKECFGFALHMFDGKRLPLHAVKNIEVQGPALDERIYAKFTGQAEGNLEIKVEESKATANQKKADAKTEQKQEQKRDSLETVKIHACTGKIASGAKGWGYILEKGGKTHENIGVYRTKPEKSQEEEVFYLLAPVINALSKLTKPGNLVIYSNHPGFVDTINEGILEDYANNGWRKADGSSIKNKSQWEMLYNLIKKHPRCKAYLDPDRDATCMNLIRERLQSFQKAS